MNFDSTTFYIKDTQLSIALDLKPQNFDVNVNAIASSRNGMVAMTKAVRWITLSTLLSGIIRTNIKPF
jgi:hypothetical protein